RRILSYTLFPCTTLFRSGPDDVRDEGDHARDREEDRRVVRDQRGAGHDLVLLLLEVGEEAPVDLGGAHGSGVSFLELRGRGAARSEEHTSELQSRENLVC